MQKVLLAAIVLILVAGCSQQIRYSPGELEVFEPKTREHIQKKEVSLGMSQAAVRYSWGAPIAVKTFPEENKEIWLYSSLRVYVTKLTFVDGKLVGSSSSLSINNPLTFSDKESGPEPAASADTPSDTSQPEDAPGKTGE